MAGAIAAAAIPILTEIASAAAGALGSWGAGKLYDTAVSGIGKFINRGGTNVLTRGARALAKAAQENYHHVVKGIGDSWNLRPDWLRTGPSFSGWDVGASLGAEAAPWPRDPTEDRFGFAKPTGWKRPPKGIREVFAPKKTIPIMDHDPIDMDISDFLPSATEDPVLKTPVPQTVSRAPEVFRERTHGNTTGGDHVEQMAPDIIIRKNRDVTIASMYNRPWVLKRGYGKMSDIGQDIFDGDTPFTSNQPTPVMNSEWAKPVAFLPPRSPEPATLERPSFVAKSLQPWVKQGFGAYPPVRPVVPHRGHMKSMEYVAPKNFDWPGLHGRELLFPSVRAPLSGSSKSGYVPPAIIADEPFRKISSPGAPKSGVESFWKVGGEHMKAQSKKNKLLVKPPPLQIDPKKLFTGPRGAPLPPLPARAVKKSKVPKKPVKSIPRD